MTPCSLVFAFLLHVSSGMQLLPTPHSHISTHGLFYVHPECVRVHSRVEREAQNTSSVVSGVFTSAFSRGQGLSDLNPITRRKHFSAGGKGSLFSSVPLDPFIF